MQRVQKTKGTVAQAETNQRATRDRGPGFEGNYFKSDDHFYKLFPAGIGKLCGRQWTPLNVAKQAATFLAAEKNVKILDIGSGVGSFCIAAAYYNPHALYFGIEQREDLVEYARTATKKIGLNNIVFSHGNFTAMDMKPYDHFYFFNSFYENLASLGNIDESIPYSGELFNYYSHMLFKQLEKKPAGTRLATYHSMENEIPPDYHVVGSDLENILKFWIKV